MNLDEIHCLTMECFWFSVHLSMHQPENVIIIYFILYHNVIVLQFQKLFMGT